MARNRGYSPKLNALVDRETIESLYRASQAGVPIDLVVRGICCLRPGLPGISDSIRVRSIVDRFLEHSRIFVFGTGSSKRVFLSSADWMPRNFERRVEVMFPVEWPDLVQRICKEMIPVYLEDNTKARVLSSDGTYVRAAASQDGDILRSQENLLFGADADTPAQLPSLATSDNGQVVKSGSSKKKEPK